MRKIHGLMGVFLMTALGFGAAQAQPKCEVDRPVVFAGLDYDSAAFHNAVAQRILRDGYGCKTDALPGTVIPLINGMLRGDVQVNMEIWKSNQPVNWTGGVAAGTLVEVGVNFPDATQGWYVPRYLVEGAKAPAPGLKSVSDLPKFKALFADPEEPGKGRFYNCPAGWQCEFFNTKKLHAYGLDANYTNFRPGTGAALDAAITSAIKRNKPVLFYYWSPTWLMGQLGNQLVQLQEPLFDATVWDALTAAKDAKDVTAATAYPVVSVVIGARKDFLDAAPRLHAFLAHYRTSAALVSEALSYMQQHKAGADDAARHFLQTHEAVWKVWVPADVAARVKAGL